MEITLKEVMSISGHSGLFKFVSQGRNGVIVESLTDGKRMNASTSSKVSTLSDIAIFTDAGEVPLREVLMGIREKENGGPAISHKSDAKKLKEYFASILPNYSRDQVYDSHIQKIVLWYNQLQEKGLLNLLDKSEEQTADDDGVSTQASAEDVEQ